MNIFNRFFLRRPVFTVLLVLLLALAVGFSCIGCSSWSSAHAQIAQINSGYRTLALPTPLDPYRYGGRPIDSLAPHDGNIHFVDGTVLYSKEHIEAVAEQAPQVERIERCGLLSAALKNCKGLSSGSLDPLQYNDEFERYNYSFSVLALRCTAIEPVTEEASIEQIDGMTVETIGHIRYDAQFEVIGCPSLHPAYGDLTGKTVYIVAGGFSPYRADLTLPFEVGKSYIVRAYFEDLPILYGWDYDDPDQTEMRLMQASEERFQRQIHFVCLALNECYEFDTENEQVQEENIDIACMMQNKNLRLAEQQLQDGVLTYICYCFPEDALPFYAEYTGDWEDFLNTEDGAVWRDTIIPWTKLNQDSAAVVLTDDLNSVYNFNAGVASIMDGRAFTQEEYESGGSVCLVSSGFAMYNGLSVGDTISLDYYHTKVVEGYLYIDGILRSDTDSVFQRETLCPEDRIGVEKEYTIVGIYSAPEFSAGQYNFSADTIFVPKSSVENAEAYEEPDVAYLNSIILKNGTEDAFEAYMQEHDMGESFVYTNMSFDAVLPALEAMAANALRLFLIGIALFVLVAATGGVLILLRVKPTVRSARLIGAEPPLLRKQLACSLLVPFSAAALLGASAGAAFFGSVTKALLENTQEMDLTALLLCAAAELVLLLVLGLLLGLSAASPKLMDSTKRPKGAKR